MAHVEGEITIDRPVDEVFDFVADERNEPRYNPQMIQAEKTSPGPIGTGTTFRAQTMTRGRPVGMTIETTGYERPRKLGISTRLPAMDIHGILTFDPVPVGTLMRWSWDVEPHGLLRLLTPMIARWGRRQEETIWAGLKRFLEGNPAAPRP